MKDLSSIITSPRITEKGAYLSEKGVYVFNIAKDASKKDVAEAIKLVYKVTPIRVRVAAVPSKAVFTRGTNRWGKTRSGKKAYVYLKSGDKIELM
ncbi:MAG: 50S ribosomal protein L23 [Patescibacteria group bacterium]